MGFEVSEELGGEAEPEGEVELEEGTAGSGGAAELGGAELGGAAEAELAAA